MDTIDTNAQNLPKPPVYNTALRYGGIFGGIMVLFSIIIYLSDVNIMQASGMVSMYGTILVAGFATAALAMRYQRDKLDGGMISYSRALWVGFLVVMIGMFISSMWNYVFINFIDTEYVNRMKEQFMATYGENMSEEMQEKVMEGFEKSGNFLQTLQSAIIGGAIFGLIIGLIMAAFMKREPRQDFMG